MYIGIFSVQMVTFMFRKNSNFIRAYTISLFTLYSSTFSLLLKSIVILPIHI
jgi:hypothetical protein